MERRPCTNQEECRLAKLPRGCFEDVHHEVFPRRNYTGKLEKEYRELDINKVLGCRALHDEFHATHEPPPKPPGNVMRAAVNAARVRAMIDANEV